MQRILTVLVMLMMIFTSSIGNSIVAEKAKGKKEKAKTSQQEQTPMKKKPIPGIVPEAEANKEAERAREQKMEELEDEGKAIKAQSGVYYDEVSRARNNLVSQIQKLKLMAQKINSGKSIGKYDLKPFDLSRTMLPKNYMGHDLKSIWEALKKREKNAVKDDYETTVQYNQRIQDAENKPLIGKLTVNDFLSFIVTFDDVQIVDDDSLVKTLFKYNADSQTLTLMIGTETVREGVWEDSSRGGIGGPNLYLRKSTYIGSNAYGASAEVEKIRTKDVVLAFSNRLALPLVPSPAKFEFLHGPLKLDLSNITPETVKAIRENLCIAFIYKLEEPYLSEGFLRLAPTRDDPDDFLFVSENILTSVKEIWVFNKTTGEILKKVKTEDVKSEDGVPAD